MKKIFLMAVMSLVFFAVSCKKDDEKNETQSIEGTWYPESFISIVGEGTKTEPANECEKKSTYTFSNGTMKVVTYEIVSGECKTTVQTTETYAISGNSIVFTNKYNEKDNSTFSIEGNTLTINFEHDGGVILRKR